MASKDKLFARSFHKVRGCSHCDAIFAEAIPKLADEIASTGKERLFRNDTGIEIATLRKPCLLDKVYLIKNRK